MRIAVASGALALMLMAWVAGNDGEEEETMKRAGEIRLDVVVEDEAGGGSESTNETASRAIAGTGRIRLEVEEKRSGGRGLHGNGELPREDVRRGDATDRGKGDEDTSARVGRGKSHHGGTTSEGFGEEHRRGEWPRTNAREAEMRDGSDAQWPSGSVMRWWRNSREREGFWATVSLVILFVALSAAVLGTRLLRRCRPSTSLYWSPSVWGERALVKDLIARRVQRFLSVRKKKRRCRQERESHPLLPLSDSSDGNSDSPPSSP